MTRTLTKSAELVEGDYIRAASSLRDAIAFLDVALQRITRLYPDQEHEYRESIRTIHADSTELYVALSHEYGTKYNTMPNTLMRMARHEISSREQAGPPPQPVESGNGKSEVAK